MPLATPWAPTASKRRQGAGEWRVGMKDLSFRAIVRGGAVAVNGRGAYAARMSIPAQVGVSFLRSKLLPAAIVLLFALALVAVSARIWLPGDMAAPAPLS